MATKNKLLSVLSEAEQFALYGLPDFDDGQRLDYLSLDKAELALVSRRSSLGAQVYCALQIGYCKAKHAFFRFSWDEVQEDGTFVLTRYFNGQAFEPRFTDRKVQLKQLCCTGDPTRYDKALIRPAGVIDTQVIVDEKASIDQIVATLALKEMTQGTLIRKLCTYTAPNPTRRAIFEFDKLIRSLYTLRYLRDPQLQRNVHHSQNRIESYHQLRSAIAQVGGKKELTGRTDLDIEISNQCGRLVANAIIYYNSAILSRLLEKYGAGSNPKILALLKKVSPAAWRHIHLNGHYTFRGNGHILDLEAIVAGLKLG